MGKVRACRRSCHHRSGTDCRLRRGQGVPITDWGSDWGSDRESDHEQGGFENQREAPRDGRQLAVFLGPRVWGVLSAGMAVLVASGCGSGSHDPKMIVTYEKASTGQAIIGRAMMTRTHLLDDVADKTNHTLDLPYDIALVGAQCGEANAFWNFAEKKITICYEDADLSLRAFKAAGDSDPIPAAVNAELAISYHEFARRADGCEDEYKQLARSWSTLLAPYQKHK